VYFPHKIWKQFIVHSKSRKARGCCLFWFCIFREVKNMTDRPSGRNNTLTFYMRGRWYAFMVAKPYIVHCKTFTKTVNATNDDFMVTIKKVQQCHYRPAQALRVPVVSGCQISWQSAHESGKVVSPTHRPTLPPSKYSWYSFLLEAESTPVP